MTKSLRALLWTILLTVVPTFGSTQPVRDPCLGLVQDKLPHPMTPLAKPALGEVVVDPEFGTRIRRISAASEQGANPAIRPMYSTTSAWNADESFLILYEVGTGHRLHDGRTYAFIRYLDIAPADLEQVYWHTSNPDILYYVDGKTLIRYHVQSGQKEALRTFACEGNVRADSHAFTSWDSRRLGLQCDGYIFIYDIETDEFTGGGASSLEPPMMAPSGALAYFHGWVLDETCQPLRQLDIAEPDTHASLDYSSIGHDVLNGAMYDPGPHGSGVGTLVTHDMVDGSSQVIVGPATGYPYPPSATHISSLAYKRHGWVFASIVGDPAGTGVLDNELLIANTDTGTVCRIAHHRSWGKQNTHLSTPYWAEPHVIPSPSGTRALFASDWGNGTTVDAYVVELPGYVAQPAGLRVERAR